MQKEPQKLKGEFQSGKKEASLKFMLKTDLGFDNKSNSSQKNQSQKQCLVGDNIYQRQYTCKQNSANFLQNQESSNDYEDVKRLLLRQQQFAYVNNAQTMSCLQRIGNLESLYKITQVQKYQNPLYQQVHRENIVALVDSETGIVYNQSTPYSQQLTDNIIAQIQHSDVQKEVTGKQTGETWPQLHMQTNQRLLLSDLNKNISIEQVEYNKEFLPYKRQEAQDLANTEHNLTQNQKKVTKNSEQSYIEASAISENDNFSDAYSDLLIKADRSTQIDENMKNDIILGIPKCHSTRKQDKIDSEVVKIQIDNLNNESKKLKFDKKVDGQLEGKDVPFELPKQKFWTKGLIKFRSYVPDQLNCHHVWWVLHFAVTAILLWLYFSPQNHGKIHVNAGTLAIIELLVGVFFRNELVISILHLVVGLCPFGKRFCNRMLHCIGGVHTSAAVCVVIWLAIFLGKETRDIAILTVGGLLLALVIIVSLTALPPIRRKYHNSFEFVHRFIGWTALGLLIALVVLIQIKSLGTLKQAFRGAPVLLTLFITLIIILPWAMVSKRKVDWKQPSSLLTVATFRGIFFPYGRVSRISLDGIEWHAFAIALTDASKNSHSLVIAKAGDWTGRISEGCEKGTLPKKVWVRNLKSVGFMYSIHAYRRVLIVCTGSGIAPALPYIQNPVPTTSTFVLWIAKKHREVYGDFIMDLVEKTSPNFTLHDTSVNGRPSVDLVVEWYYQIQAEAVFVVSNEPFTNKIVNGLWKKAIPSYGALFDS